VKSVIIGVGGGSGSGKSTFCDILKSRLPDVDVTVINMDRYFKNPLPKMVSPVTGETADDYNHPDSVDYQKPLRILKELKTGGEPGVVIIEGVLLFCYEDVRKELDLKIFIELDSDERMFRRIKRNMERRGLSMDEIADYYLNFAKFREADYALKSKAYADITINGRDFGGRPADVIVSWVKDFIKT